MFQSACWGMIVARTVSDLGDENVVKRQKMFPSIGRPIIYFLSQSAR
jgi:hypothetical protein